MKITMKNTDMDQQIAEIEKKLEKIEKFLNKFEGDLIGEIQTPDQRKAERRKQELLKALERRKRGRDNQKG